MPKYDPYAERNRDESRFVDQGDWYVSRDPQPIGRGSYAELEYRKSRDERRDADKKRRDAEIDARFQELEARREARRDRELEKRLKREVQKEKVLKRRDTLRRLTPKVPSVGVVRSVRGVSGRHSPIQLVNKVRRFNFDKAINIRDNIPTDPFKNKSIPKFNDNYYKKQFRKASTYDKKLSLFTRKSNQFFKQKKSKYKNSRKRYSRKGKYRKRR